MIIAVDDAEEERELALLKKRVERAAEIDRLKRQLSSFNKISTSSSTIELAPAPSSTSDDVASVSTSISLFPPPALASVSLVASDNASVLPLVTTALVAHPPPPPPKNKLASMLNLTVTTREEFNALREEEARKRSYQVQSSAHDPRALKKKDSNPENDQLKKKTKKENIRLCNQQRWAKIAVYVTESLLIHSI